MVIKDLYDNDLKRAELQEKLYHYYNGNEYQILQYLKKAMSKTWEEDDLREFQEDYINITKKIVNQLAVVYRDPAARSIIKGDAVNEFLTNYYNGIISENINTVDKQAHRYAKLCNVSLTRIAFSEGKIKYRVLPTHVYRVKTDPDDPYKMTEVSYEKLFYENDKAELYRVVWTDKQHYRVKVVDIKVLNQVTTYLDPRPIGNNKDMVNPYGVIPYAILRLEEQGEDFYGMGLADVVNMNEQINVLLTELQNEQIILGGVGTVLAVNLGLKKKEENGQMGLRKVRVGRKHPLVVEDVREDYKDPRLEYVTTDPIITDVRDTIDWKIKIIALSKGLNPNSYSLETLATSGFSKVMDAMEQFELRTDDIEPCRLYEADRYRKTVAIHEYHKGLAGGESLKNSLEGTLLKVDFAEIKQPRTVTEQIEETKFKLEANLTNLIKEAKKDNPDLSDKEVEQEIIKNKEINERIGYGFKDGSQAGYSQQQR